MTSKARSVVKMVGAAGLEPATVGLEIRCSIRLSYAPSVCNSNKARKLEWAIQVHGPCSMFDCACFVYFGQDLKFPKTG